MTNTTDTIHATGHWKLYQGTIMQSGDNTPVALIVNTKDESVRALVRNANAAPDLLEALAAIVARIDGEYDHPALMAALPALSVDTDDDVRAIARDAIAKARGETTEGAQ